MRRSRSNPGMKRNGDPRSGSQIVPRRKRCRPGSSHGRATARRQGTRCRVLGRGIGVHIGSPALTPRPAVALEKREPDAAAPGWSSFSSPQFPIYGQATDVCRAVSALARDRRSAQGVRRCSRPWRRSGWPPPYSALRSAAAQPKKRAARPATLPTSLVYHSYALRRRLRCRHAARGGGRVLPLMRPTARRSACRHRVSQLVRPTPHTPACCPRRVERPGSSLTLWTGSIPDTIPRPFPPRSAAAHAAERSGGNGDRGRPRRARGRRSAKGAEPEPLYVLSPPNL